MKPGWRSRLDNKTSLLDVAMKIYKEIDNVSLMYTNNYSLRLYMYHFVSMTLKNMISRKC